MKAVRVYQFGDESQNKVEENVPIPKPGPGQVLIKLYTAGVNPHDVKVREGAHGPRPFPFIPGQDGAGVVEDVGEGVQTFKTGERVMTSQAETGTYCEYTVADTLRTIHLANRISFDQASAFGVPYYTAYKALLIRCRGTPGETVLVHGASGAVGVAAVQLAKSQGFKVIGTAGTEEGIRLVKQQGADFVYNHRTQGYMDKITTEGTDGQGVDIVLEMLANVNLQQDLELLNYNGRIAVIGSRGDINITPRTTMIKECEVTGVNLPRSTPAQWREMNAFFEAAQDYDWLQPSVGKSYPIAEVAKAQYDVMNIQSTKGKLILAIR